jgi:carotenoid cleavage dioxygenase-like enzyme
MYFITQFEKVADSDAARENVNSAGFIKVNTETKKIIGEISYGPTNSGGEIFFQPRDNATSEDDGYLMTFVHCWETDTSEFVMWDAQTMSSEPILRVALKQRVPNGFHGMFVKEEDL